MRGSSSKGLTLIIAMIWGDGVVVTADVRASSGYIMHEEKKLYPISVDVGKDELDLAVVGGSGDSALVKQGADLIKSEFFEWFDRRKTQRHPTLLELNQIVSGIESKLIDRYSELVRAGVSVETELLLASMSSDRTPVIFTFDSRGIANPHHEVPGYALLGMGSVTGGQLLLRLMDYSPGLDIDRGLLSAFILDTVSEVDPTVSPFLGDSFYLRFDDEQNRPISGRLNAESLKKYKETAQVKRRMMQLVWQAGENMGDDKLLKFLEDAAVTPATGRPSKQTRSRALASSSSRQTSKRQTLPRKSLKMGKENK